MKQDLQKGRLIPIKQPINGRWVPPADAAKLARNGKGIKLYYLMEKIYAGKLIGFVKRDHLGSWWVFVPDNEIKQTEPLRAA